MNRITRILIASILVLGSAAVQAQSTAISFDLPRQPLSDSLRAVGTLAGINVLFDPPLVENRQAPALRDTLTSKEAIGRLLKGTGLEYEFVSDRTVAIHVKKAEPASAASRAIASSQWVQRAVPEGAQAQSSGESSAGPGTAPEEEARGTPEILVKGRRSVNTDIQRTADDAQPYVVFDREQIERSMSNNLEDFFKTRLPMNTTQTVNAQRNGNVFGSQSEINLRGLGAKQTLILVDGRRLAGVNTGGSDFGQPDINGIPLSSIERIEVLPSTASGIYGGGATGGVINIITRQDYTGLDLNVAYNNAFDSDVTGRRIDGSAGFSLEGGRTQLTISGSFSDSNALRVGERDFAARGRALQLRNNPASFTTGTTPPAGSTTNIRRQDGQPLQLKLQYGGQTLSSARTYVPLGYRGLALDGVAPLIANVGQYNLQLPDDVSSLRQSALSNPEVRSGTLNLRRSFGEGVHAFLDVSTRQNHSRIFNAGLISSTTLAATAPNNPFTTAVSVRFPTVGLETPPRESSSDSLRATAGVIVRLGRDWTAAADYGWNRSKLETAIVQAAIGDPDGAGPGLSAATAFSRGILDVMRDLNLSPLDYTPYLLEQPSYVFGPARTEMEQPSVRVSGPLWRLPGGPVVITALAEQRRMHTFDTFDDFRLPGSLTTADYMPAAAQNVESYYVETRVPLFSGANGRPLLRALDLQLSVRHDSYSTHAASPNYIEVPSRQGPLPDLTFTTNTVADASYTVGLRYSPAEDLTLRASVGTGFLPPGLDQILPFQDFQDVFFNDPRRGGEPTSIDALPVLTGGNPDVKPEDSRSVSVGAIFTPHFLPDLRLSVDYTRIRKTNEITDLTIPLLLDLEANYPGRVVRGALDPADAALGYTGGVVESFDVTAVNFAASKVEAYDLRADYGLDAGAGRFEFFAAATWEPHFERQTGPGDPLIDYVGFSSSPLEWRGNAGLTWKRSAWTLGWSSQFYDAYRIYTATANPTAIATAVRNQGSDTIPSQLYHDIFAIYRFGNTSGFAGRFLENAQLSAGIQNVFGREPPILATTGTSGGYSTYADPRLRRYSISLRKAFGR